MQIIIIARLGSSYPKKRDIIIVLKMTMIFFLNMYLKIVVFFFCLLPI